MDKLTIDMLVPKYEIPKFVKDIPIELQGYMGAASEGIGNLVSMYEQSPNSIKQAIKHPAYAAAKTIYPIAKAIVTTPEYMPQSAEELVNMANPVIPGKPLATALNIAGYVVPAAKGIGKLGDLPSTYKPATVGVYGSPGTNIGNVGTAAGDVSEFNKPQVTEMRMNTNRPVDTYGKPQQQSWQEQLKKRKATISELKKYGEKDPALDPAYHVFEMFTDPESVHGITELDIDNLSEVVSRITHPKLKSYASAKLNQLANNVTALDTLHELYGITDLKPLEKVGNNSLELQKVFRDIDNTMAPNIDPGEISARKIAVQRAFKSRSNWDVYNPKKGEPYKTYYETYHQEHPINLVTLSKFSDSPEVDAITAKIRMINHEKLFNNLMGNVRDLKLPDVIKLENSKSPTYWSSFNSKYGIGGEEIE